jgi:hypothetical protein
VRTGEWSLVLDGAAIVADGSVTVDQASTFEALNRDASRSHDLLVAADAMGLRFDSESKRMVGAASFTPSRPNAPAATDSKSSSRASSSKPR